MTYVTRRQRAEKRKKRFKLVAIAIAAVAIICLTLFCFLSWRSSEEHRKAVAGLNIPEYSGQAYVVMNNNVPCHTDI